jgi:hypothetical protein
MLQCIVGVGADTSDLVSSPLQSIKGVPPVQAIHSPSGGFDYITSPMVGFVMLQFLRGVLFNVIEALGGVDSVGGGRPTLPTDTLPLP